ncbi:MAG: DNA-deoxyinosine glycosylase, partial [Campylobacteraceae bacterium]|nr:DNA-deoxyinosine glycosylase [Campylobacteraceae bacterium]
MRKYEILTHPWECVFNEHSKVLILGSFPSVKSRQNGFYYGHSQNIFWRTLSLVLQKPPSLNDKESKIAFLLQNDIALWDVLYSCKIAGSNDNTIRNPVPNDFSAVFEKAKIRAVFTTGKMSTALFWKLCSKKYGLEPFYLPSTSPANRAWHKGHCSVL